MNISTIIGFSMALFVFVVGLWLSSDDLKIFLDYPSLFIVTGGTLAATAISFDVTRLMELLKIFFRRLVFNKRINYMTTIEEVMEAAEKYRKGEEISSIINSVNDEFFKECLELYGSDVLEKEEFLDIIYDRADRILESYGEEANKIKSISKFPPAFGMMGTTIGMIVLLANLGGEDAIKMIGPAMGVCLITTLYGVAIANLFFIPFAENLSANNKEIYLKKMIIIEGVSLLIEKTNPIIVGIKLNSFLKPSQRMDKKLESRTV
ncbi:motility protein A [Halobacteriovorax sp. ZH4_bin.1]|uniref:motility protein A n=1 Tax=unclassified Halobacteriovorax TaxID=2639665 RepID=UPI0037230977